MTRKAWVILVLVAFHVASARLNGAAAPAQTYASFLSPPTGISLVAVMICGRSVTAGVFLGSLLLRLMQGASLATALFLGASNVVEVLVATALLARGGFQPSLERLRDVAALATATALVAAPLGTTLAMVVLVANGTVSYQHLAASWFVRWWGHAAGAIVVAPALFTWIANRHVDRHRIVEVAAFASALVLALALVVGEPTPPWPEGVPATYILFPMLAWAAIRFGPRGAATTVLAVTTAAMSATAAGAGPFVQHVWHQGVANVQAFVALLAVSTLILAAAAAERVSGRTLARTTEVRRAAMVEAALDAIVTVDACARVQEMNPAAESMFGLDGAKSRGKSMAELMGPGGERLAECIASEGSASLGRLREVRALRADGTAFLAEMCVVRLPTGTPEFSAFMRDVTELRRAEDALRAAHVECERRVVERTDALRAANEELVARQRKLEEVYALARIGTFDWGVRDGHVLWSAELHHIFDVDPDSFEGTIEAFFLAVHPTERARIRAAMDAILAAKVSFEVANPILLAGGRTVIVQTRGSVVTDSSGEPVRVVGTCQDVSERRSGEAAQARLAAIVEGSEDAMVAIDGANAIRSANLGAVRMFGWPASELVGRPVESVVAADVRGFLASVRRGERVGAFETIGLRKDETRFDVSVQLSAIAGSGAGDVSMVARDITIAKATRRQLEAALHEKEVLLHEVHHRVKNNLQIVSSLLHLQAASIADVAARRAFEESENRVRAIALVHGLLQGDEEDRLDAHEYLERLVMHLRSAYDGREDVTVAVEASPIPLPLEKAVPLGLMVSELVSNAMKHAFQPGRGGHVVVSLREANGTKVLSVADDGRGIPAELDWHRVSTVGLQVVRALAKQLEGCIDLERARGTTFRVTFKS